MECNLKNRQELMNRYITGELSEGDAKAFEEHYFQCEVCFRELRALEDAVNLIEDEGKLALDFKKPEQKTEKNNLIEKIFSTPDKVKLNWGVAVSLIIIFAVLIITLPTNDENIVDKNNAAATTKDSSAIKNTPGTLKNPENEPIKVNPPQKPVEEFAENLSGPEFKPNAYLEEWSTENVRSENENLDRVISPTAGEKFYNKEIRFNWIMNKSEPLTLKILTNQEKEIYNKNLSQNNSSTLSVDVSPAIFEHSGLYYWKIEDENEVLYVGKFYLFKVIK